VPAATAGCDSRQPSASIPAVIQRPDGIIPELLLPTSKLAPLAGRRHLPLVIARLAERRIPTCIAMNNAWLPGNAEPQLGTRTRCA
jgi:hypothetical protein